MRTKEFTDFDGKKRVFEFKSFSCPTGFVYEATEIQDGEPKGMRFSVLGTEDGAEVWRYELEQRVKRALKGRHIEYHKESNTWVTCDHIIRGQIRWDDETEGETPLIVVDGKDLTWTEFGKTMMTHEGFQFVLAGMCPANPVLQNGVKGHNMNRNYLTGKPFRHAQGRELGRTAPLFRAESFTFVDPTDDAMEIK